MGVRVNASLYLEDAAKILTERGLQPGGKVQKHITTELIGMFDGYVPLRSGTLKGSALRNNLSPPHDVIKYDGPYAARLYYNPRYNYNEKPRRGAFWDKRAWSDNKEAFLADLENYVKKGV